MAPVIASIWANCPCKCQGEVRTWKIQEEVGWLNVTPAERRLPPCPKPFWPLSLSLSTESCVHGWSQVVSSPCSDSLCERLWGKFPERILQLWFLLLLSHESCYHLLYLLSDVNISLSEFLDVNQQSHCTDGRLKHRDINKHTQKYVQWVTEDAKPGFSAS